MRLKEEKRQYPARVDRKIKVYSDGWCALITAALGDFTPEEAFLSIERRRPYKFIKHRKYTTNDIYTMLYLSEVRGRTLVDIAKIYKLTPKMVRQIVGTYGGDRYSMARCKACGAQIDWIIMQSGKKMPMDKKYITIIADPAGKIVGITPEGKVIRGNLAMVGTDGVITVKASHFSTCPEASKFRRQ